MEIAGFGQTARESANDLFLIWSFLPENELSEQVESHLESEGFDSEEIADAMEFVGLSFFGEREFVIVGPA